MEKGGHYFKGISLIKGNLDPFPFAMSALFFELLLGQLRSFSTSPDARPPIAMRRYH